MFEFKGSAAEFLQLNCLLFFTDQLHVYTPTPGPVALHFTKWLSNPPRTVQNPPPPQSPMLSHAAAFYLGGWLLQTTKILSKKVPSSYSFLVISSFVISYTVQSLSPILFNPVLIIQ